jgi:hypothetical protein
MTRKRSLHLGLNKKTGVRIEGDKTNQEDEDESISTHDNAKQQEIKNPIPQKLPSVPGSNVVEAGRFQQCVHDSTILKFLMLRLPP